MNIQKVGNAIAYLRKRAGYTQKELADRIGISDKAVSKWERGQGLPEIGYLRKLSILLDTDSDSLLAGDVVHHKSEWKGIILLDSNPYGIGAGTVIYDKPLINYFLSYFLLVGIKDIYVGCNNFADKSYIDETIRDGRDYGIHVFTVSNGLKGIEQEMKKNDIQKDDTSIMLLYGRMILYGVDQTRFFQKAMMERAHLTMLALPKKMDQRSLTVDVDKKVINNHQARLRMQYDFSELPILLFPATLLPQINNCSSVDSFLEEQKTAENVYVEMLDRGFVEIEIDNWNNVQEASTFMKIVQEKCGMNVYCLEEVAWRRGFISLDQLKKHGEKRRSNEYGEYILSLCNRIEEKRSTE